MHTYVLHGSLYKNGNKRESGVEGHGQKKLNEYKKKCMEKIKIHKRYYKDWRKWYQQLQPSFCVHSSIEKRIDKMLMQVITNI